MFLNKIKNSIIKKKLIFKLKKAQQNVESSSNNISCIIFSMDRAMQLHALLSSMFKNDCSNLTVSVLYRCSSAIHNESYLDLIRIFKDRVNFIEERGCFKGDLESIFDKMSSSKVFFLVDDIVFIKPFDFDFLDTVDTQSCIFSLRMGKNLSYSYVVDKIQPLPIYREEGEFITWSWGDGTLDWAYPLSVDGHLFNSEEMKILVKSLSYTAPNSFENALQTVKNHFFNRKGLSSKSSIIMNIPCNKVQNEVSNISGDIDPNELLALWNKGLAIDIEDIQGFSNKSVHQIVTFHYKEREN